MHRLRLIFLILLNLSASPTLFADVPQQDLLIYFRQRADLSRGPAITAREHRLQFVRQNLLSAARSSQARVTAFLRGRHISTRAFYIENAILARHVDRRTLQALAQFTEIEFLRPDVRVALDTLPAPTHPARRFVSATPSFMADLGVERVWNELGVRGKGIVVAGADSGYYWEHSALKKQYRGSAKSLSGHNYNWHDAFAASLNPIDDSGHGTHTMGTIVGGDGGQNNIGIAPEAQWIGCRNMRGNVGSLSSYLDCMEFLLAPYPQGGSARVDGRPDLAPHIINNSWSCPATEGCQGDELIGAVRAFKAAGIFFVVAAGNSGPACATLSQAPGFYIGDVMSVGSYNRYGREVAFFSARGPSLWNGKVGPTLIALGDDVRSADIGGPSAYKDRMGTSMASAQVAGVVALLWSARPELIGQIDRTHEILQRTAKPIASPESCGGLPGSAIPNSSSGYGLIDAYAAVTVH